MFLQQKYRTILLCFIMLMGSPSFVFSLTEVECIALKEAITKSDKAAVIWLIEQANQREINDALSHAVSNNNCAMVDFLLKNSKRPLNINEDMLCQAVYNDDLDIVKCLVNHGAIITYTILRAIISRKNCIAMLTCFLEAPRKQQEFYPFLFDLLNYAWINDCNNMRDCLANYLITHDLTGIYLGKLNPISWPVEKFTQFVTRHIDTLSPAEIQQLLYETLGTVSTIELYDRYYRRNVKSNEYEAVVLILLTKRPELKSQALYFAARNNHTTIARNLIAQGASSRAESELVLHRMIEANDLLSVQALVAQGSDIHARELNFWKLRWYEEIVGGPSALKLAVNHGHWELAAYLVEQGANIYQDALYKAAQGKGLYFIRFLTENINTFSLEQYPLLLTIAAYNGDLDLVKYLVDNNVDIDAKNPFTLNCHCHSVVGTALQAAYKKEHYPIVKFLLDRGANQDCLTPVDIEHLRSKFPEWSIVNSTEILAAIDSLQLVDDGNLSCIKKNIQDVSTRDLSWLHGQNQTVTPELVTHVVRHHAAKEIEATQTRSSDIVNIGPQGKPFLMTRKTYQLWLNRHEKSPIYNKISKGAVQPIKNYAAFMEEYMQPQYANNNEFIGFAIPLSSLPAYILQEEEDILQEEDNNDNLSFCISEQEARELINLWLFGHRQEAYVHPLIGKILDEGLVPTNDATHARYYTTNLYDATCESIKHGYGETLA
ncbi:ankyrin repeat domain-containing protein [Candidatus Dependentiae bacterium]|nr:ankyrin repeat domain-containing protein [Candidatus Dependentiae bacterium]